MKLSLQQGVIFFILTINILTNYSVSTKIAIIGSGIGGTHTAYLILKKNSESEIHLFEQNTKAGGRINSVIIGDEYDELGAGFFITENQILNNLVKELKIPLKDPQVDKSIGMWNGDKALQFTVGNYFLLNIPKLIYRYGMSLFWAKKNIDKNLSEFMRIYPEIEKGNSFKSLGSLLSFWKLKELIHQSFEDYLIKEGFNRFYINEMLSCVIAGIYNQNVNFNGFAGMVTLASMFGTPNSIKGGNYIIIERMIEALTKSNKFKLSLNTKVTEIEKLVNGKFSVKTNTGLVEEFDTVVIAAPLLKTDIEFKNIELKSNIRPKNFQRTHVYYIRSELKYERFGLCDYSEVPWAIMSMNKLKTDISEFLKMEKDLYKVQSDTKLSEEELSEYFIKPNILVYKDWLYAYPKLDVMKDEELPDFVIDNNLYHVNAIETAASAMELSLISSKNIVNMIVGGNATANKDKKVDL